MTFRSVFRPLAALAAVALFVLNPSVASAESANVTFVDDGPGWGSMYNGTIGAGSLEFTVDGTTVEAYCVQMNVLVNRTSDYSPVDPTSTAVPNLNIAAWIAANHNSVPTPAANISDEHAATQLAIWHYTDGIAINATTVPDAEVRPRAAALVAAAAAQDFDLVAADTEVTISGVADGNEVVWTVNTTADGDAAAAAEVTITSGSTTIDATTDATGAVTVRTPRAASGATNADVSWEVATGAGAIIAPDDGGQIIVTATPTDAVRTAPASVAAQAPPTTAPAPPATDVTPTPPAAEPTPTPAAPAAPPARTGTLPRTGGALGWDQALVAAALLAIGGAALVRRRRMS